MQRQRAGESRRLRSTNPKKKQPATSPAKRKATRRNPKADSKAKRPKATKKPQPKAKQKKPVVMGRPSLYSEEIAARICAGLSAGKTLGKVCSAEGMPERQTVYYWIHSMPEFFDRFTRAREAGTHAIADDILDIADDARHDLLEEVDKNGETKTVQNNVAIQRAKLMIASRFTLMSRLNPGKFSDKVDIKHSGSVVAGVTLDEGVRQALIERRKKAMEEEAAQEEEAAAGADKVEA